MNFGEYSWKHITLNLGGVPITTLQNISISQSVDKRYIYGERDESSTIISGRTQTSGTMSMLQSDFELLNSVVPGLKILNTNKFTVVILFKKNPSVKTIPTKGIDEFISISTYTLLGVSFTNWDFNFSQGSMNTVVNLPFIASRLIPQSVPPVGSVLADKIKSVLNTIKRFY